MTGLKGMTGSSNLEALDVKALGRAAFCDVSKPIRWSVKDTDETIAQVKRFNVTGVTLCKWH